jgi:hypothetical protein
VESSALDPDDSEEDMLSNAPGDESAHMEEDEGEEQQEVFESTFENPVLNPEPLLPMSEDVDMTELEAQAPVTNEPISNIIEHENVSLCYRYILKLILT